ncbi:hypothetical protein DCM91_11995 [Chitinophaga costaii]|nr:hypothetical protein DCM91_11995 [Chitinophaga costaii]
MLLFCTSKKEGPRGSGANPGARRITTKDVSRRYWETFYITPGYYFCTSKMKAPAAAEQIPAQTGLPQKMLAEDIGKPFI